VSASPVVERLLPWLLRLAWIAVLVSGGAAIDSATAARSADLGDVARAAAFVGWVGGVLAMAVPAVMSLTAVRIIVPLSVPVAVAAMIAGADRLDGSLFFVASAVATAVAGSAELGRAFVQASAYGEEDRHLLRPPVAYAAAAVIAWVIAAALLISATLLLAQGRWIWGALTGLGAVGLTVFGWPRWNRLARRWFVIVPIGVVVHDSLVLGETLMLRRQELARIRLAPADTEAADLTGPASGHAVEISTNESVDVFLAATPKQPRGAVLHLRACLVAPSRPGRALTAATTRRLPVG
jgi:hypothetical protein